MAKHVAVVWVTLWLLVASGVQAQNQFTVGTEDINFYPHYNFTRADGAGFANETLKILPDFLQDARELAVTLQTFFDSQVPDATA